MINFLKNNLGPGLIFAAVAVGTSHVVQSTRAGATYGLSMILLVVLVCLVKYPTFLFSSRYAAITGHSVIDGYAKRGRWYMYIFLALILVEITIATSAASLVTSGIIKSVFNLSMQTTVLSMILIFITIMILIVGKYKALESFCKVLVIGFCITTLITTFIALTGFESSNLEPISELAFDRPTTLFLVSIAGWMPTGIIGAVLLSNWVLARKKTITDRPFTRKEADFDFHVGYVSAIFLAACFVILGYIVIRGAGGTIANDSAGFSVQIISLFTSTIGSWVFVLIAATIIAVMYSTLLALADGFPRLIVGVIDSLWPNVKNSIKESNLYIALFIVLFILVGAVYFLFMSSFTQFIDLITAIGFIVTPIIATFNHVIIFSDDIPPQERPGPGLKTWSYSTIIIFTAVTLVWIYFQLTA
ncbi:MAG: divalent metal cation transporter [Gammaproteobacteria bacterium]|jgi:Mn2+/Fe2+ NRAMP family transporter|nr:divalent metal cation transporter [Gammaproteobacteria bacterium]